ncbi:serine/threonine-protein kinase Nek4 isoform 1-T1 [Menidia menidia]
MMNNYVFIRIVGKGSYGEVNLVKNKTDRKQYVVKKLNLNTSSRRERRAAEQEAQLLSQLRHPNIVTYRESWEGQDCQLYIVMGFCEGGDLYHRLKQQKGELLPERQVVEWFVQIAMALQYLHERNILHRDLKTQNIFLTKTNIIKVGDLGIARVLESHNDMANTLIGTPYYMSPELFSNKPYNHKSDVWALGCCVYEMSTLKHAFNAKDMNSLVYRIVEGKLPQMPSRYDPQLGDLIKSMLCKRPEDRPDVKLILRQPYIKRQIAMFLEATKEKTAKSRKKSVAGSGDCRTNNALPGALSEPKPERLAESPQPGHLVRVKRKEEKSEQCKSHDGLADFPQAQILPKPSSPDVLKVSIASMATVSNIDIDIPLQQVDDVMKRQGHRSHSVMPHQQPTSETVTDSAYKGSQGQGKPDPSPPSSPIKPIPKDVSGRSSRGGEERTSPNGSTDIQPQARQNPGDTFSVFGEKQILNMDHKDDTMELLREADAQNPNLENIGVVLDVNVGSKNATLDLIKHTPTQQLQTSDIHDKLETTENLLEPPPVIPVQEEASSVATEQDQVSPCQSPNCPPKPFSLQQHIGKHKRQTQGDKNKLAASRPLPRPPVESLAVEGKRKRRKATESKKAKETTASTSITSSKDELLAPQVPKDRPLSARERRRLRQSQETVSQSGDGASRRASYDVTSLKSESQSVSVTRSASYSITESSSKDKLQEQKSDEDECCSSTSSTERSEGDCKESRKTESSDMQDLVHMMTQTLRMDVGDGGPEIEKNRFDTATLPEFKLNRKYRDTLMLHGKAREDAENLSLGEIPYEGSTSGPAKIRRVIEHLRTDVVKGLGVKLLDKVLEIMEEEDETKRELCLRDQMGDKYQTYAVMVRQLKFFEDIALKV